MGLGPDLSFINIPLIRMSAGDFGQVGGRTSGLADQLSGVQDSTSVSWQGPAGTAFGVHLTRRIQAKRLIGQALQRKASATSVYADTLEAAQAQWNSGKGLLNGLPGQLRGQVPGGGGLSLAGLGITDPVVVAGLLAQAGEALAQMVAAQVKAVR